MIHGASFSFSGSGRESGSIGLSSDILLVMLVVDGKRVELSRPLADDEAFKLLEFRGIIDAGGRRPNFDKADVGSYFKRQLNVLYALHSVL